MNFSSLKCKSGTLEATSTCLNQVRIDMPNSVTKINWTPVFEWYVLKCGSKKWIRRLHVFKRDWTTHSNMITILGGVVATIWGGGSI